eukprot:10331563-Alexandrium_andersonii.AAC.1
MLCLAGAPLANAAIERGGSGSAPMTECRILADLRMGANPASDRAVRTRAGEHDRPTPTAR